MKHRCGHIYEDLSMCQSRQLYASSSHCRKHWGDIHASSKKSKTQIKRLERLRSTIKQIKNEVGYGLDLDDEGDQRL